MEMDNYKRGLQGFQRDLNQDYHEYAKGRNIRELTSGPQAGTGGGGGGAIVLLFLGIVVIIAIIPYAIIALVSNLFIYLLLGKRFSLTYWNFYPATFFSTLVFNLFLGLIIYIFIQCLKLFNPSDLTGFIAPVAILFVGLVCAIFGTAAVFYRIIKKRIRFSLSIRYTLFLVIPVNIFLQLLPMLIFATYTLHKMNIPIPSFEEIKHLFMH
ncbi:MAG: hypothetical protein ABI763_11840 [Bacteroidota bacterium]